MNDWFEWNGVKSTVYGIYVSEHPALTIPNERVTFTDVPGRSGSLTMLEGDMVYDDMVLACTCFVADPARIPEIAAWLRGGGTVTFANRQGGFYYAHVTNQIPFEKILRGNPHRSFAVTFRCKPFFYLNPVEPITVTASGSFVTNPGTVSSEPVVTVYGTGDITLMVGMSVVELSAVPNGIVLDTPLQEAYQAHDSLNTLMNGDFPLLLPGKNAVSWQGSVSRIVIQPNWRTL